MKKQTALLSLIAGIAWIGTIGSLYYGYFGDPIANLKDGIVFSTDRALIPCSLCWYARVCLYPLAILSLIMLCQKQVGRVAAYILSLSVIGFLITVYHTSIQFFHIRSIIECGSEIPCNEIQVVYGGFITIPVLAAVSFFILIVLSILLKENEETMNV